MKDIHTRKETKLPLFVDLFLWLDCHSSCPDPGQVSTSALLAQILLPSGERVLVLRGGDNTHIKEREQAKTQPSALVLWQLGTKPHLQ